MEVNSVIVLLPVHISEWRTTGKKQYIFESSLPFLTFIIFHFWLGFIKLIGLHVCVRLSFDRHCHYFLFRMLFAVNGAARAINESMGINIEFKLLFSTHFL